MRGPNSVVKVLVVEDDKAVAQAMLARLAHEGYEVFVAGDAVSALSVARNSRPDVALLDINLPAGSGFDVARRLDNTVSRVAKIFITGSKEPGLREQAIAAGQFPGRELAHGAMILVAGALMITPGFLTDGVGFLLLVPAVREAIRRYGAKRMANRIEIL